MITDGILNEVLTIINDAEEPVSSKASRCRSSFSVLMGTTIVGKIW